MSFSLFQVGSILGVAIGSDDGGCVSREWMEWEGESASKMIAEEQGAINQVFKLFTPYLENMTKTNEKTRKHIFAEECVTHSIHEVK